MGSREQILARVKKNKPEGMPLPSVKFFEEYASENLVQAFSEVLEGVGGKVVSVSGYAEAKQQILGCYPDKKNVGSSIPELEMGGLTLDAIDDPHALHQLDLMLVKGEVGVAENGAIWVSENSLSHRVSPFITEHLAIVLEKEKLVWNMHQAYSREEVCLEGYGVFIAGPSKTADIEQSLVIGAHGPRSLLVVLI
ncbi:LUD domain-containing protein [Rapidithrix thailandica]|uniref:LUD domain-containing protein n=1 Tax=Rapidithrix thailandica TaxID=413964 RepID=A0AAW9SBU9_9BACT